MRETIHAPCARLHVVRSRLRVCVLRVRGCFGGDGVPSSDLERWLTIDSDEWRSIMQPTPRADDGPPDKVAMLAAARAYIERLRDALPLKSRKAMQELKSRRRLQAQAVARAEAEANGISQPTVRVDWVQKARDDIGAAGAAAAHRERQARKTDVAMVHRFVRSRGWLPPLQRWETVQIKEFPLQLDGEVFRASVEPVGACVALARCVLRENLRVCCVRVACCMLRARCVLPARCSCYNSRTASLVAAGNAAELS